MDGSGSVEVEVEVEDLEWLEGWHAGLWVLLGWTGFGCQAVGG